MPSLWIIDGYNFIRQSRRFSEREAIAPEEGRRAALNWLKDFAQATGERVCVVFDAYSGLHRDPISEGFGGIQVIRSRGGYTADEEIIALSQEKKQGAIIVTSDKEILQAAVKAGAAILESLEFEREVAKILERGKTEDENDRPTPRRGNPFRPPKEKKKAFSILKKYQR
jgi:uncharacterized protein